MQSSYNRSGCWRQILIAKTCLAIFSAQKKPRFEPGTYFTILVVCLLLLLIFISHTQTICNCLAPCVSIMFTSYPRSFLPIPTCPPSCCFFWDLCNSAQKSSSFLHDGGQIGIKKRRSRVARKRDTTVQCKAVTTGLGVGDKY